MRAAPSDRNSAGMNRGDRTAVPIVLRIASAIVHAGLGNVNSLLVPSEVDGRQSRCTNSEHARSARAAVERLGSLRTKPCATS